MNEHTFDSNAATTTTAINTRQAEQGQPRRDTASIVPGPLDEEQEAAIHMPSPSIWPITAAFGVTMIGFGFLGGVAFGVFGAIVLIISLWGWIGEMRHE